MLFNQISNFYSKRIQCDTRFLSIRKILISLCPYSQVINGELIEPITFEIILDNPFILNGRCYHISTIKNICLTGNKKDPFNRDDIPESIVSLFSDIIKNITNRSTTPEYSLTNYEDSLLSRYNSRWVTGLSIRTFNNEQIVSYVQPIRLERAISHRERRYNRGHPPMSEIERDSLIAYGSSQVMQERLRKLAERAERFEQSEQS